jgi:hypothetical protein
MKPNLQHQHYETELAGAEDTSVEIDWNYIAERRTQGDITIMLTWNWANKDDPEPTLVLAPTYMPPNPEDINVCTIELNDAWRWSRTHNDDEQVVDIPGSTMRLTGDQWQSEMAQYFAMCLGFNPNNPRTLNRIRGIIEDYLQDLANLPPAPVREDAHTIHAETTDINTGKVTEHTIKTV